VVIRVRVLLRVDPQEDAMSTYKFLYMVGFTPWERMIKSPAIREQISAMFDREEVGREASDGKALVLGCGSGIWTVELAKRGWEVTGVDFVPKALHRAAQRAEGAGVDVRLVEADITKLGTRDVGSGFRFLVDFGCFHDELTDEQRSAMGRAVTTVAASDANLLMIAWEPARRTFLPMGASREDIESAYSDWRLVDTEDMDTIDAPGYVKKANPRYYRLTRKVAQAP
jgi:SAM-dependent methyltransferase